MSNTTSVWVRSALCVAMASASTALFANEDNAVQLSNVVVSAAGFEQKLVEAPASISVISAEELRSRPYTSLLDAVRELEGVDVGETNDKTGQGTVSIRGMGSSYTLVLINGRRQNNHGDIYPNSFGGNQFNNIPPLDAIERIEVIRGPASTLYGADAMGGVINIITKAVGDKWGGSVSHSRTMQEHANYGDDHTTDVYLSGPLIKDHLGLAVRGSFYNKDASSPVYHSVTDPNGISHTPVMGFGSGGGRTVDNENMSYGATLSWTPAANQKVFFDIDRYKQTYDNSPVNGTASLGTVDNIDSLWRTGNAASARCYDLATGAANGFAQADCTAANGAKWARRVEPRAGYVDEQEFTRETMSITHNGQWSIGNSFVSVQKVTTNNNGRTLPLSVEERQWLQQIYNSTNLNDAAAVADAKDIVAEELLPRPARIMESDQIVLDAKLDMPFEYFGSHMVVVGGQVIRGELTDGVFGMESGKTAEAQEHNMWSVFAEDTWYVLSPLAITAGVRYDNHDIFGDHLSPRLYGVYNLTSDWTIKGGVSTGFKTPQTTDMYDGVIGFGGQGTSPQYGNSDLKPETSVSKEVAVYWQHSLENHNFNITFFQNTFDDKIASQDCGPSFTIQCGAVGDYADLGYGLSTRKVNIDKVLIQGVEVAGHIQLLDSVGLRANYTYTDSEQKSGDAEGRPFGNVAKHMANATLDWQATDAFGLFLTLESRDKRYRTWDSVADEALYFKGYEVFHLGFNYQFSKNVRLNGRINNLLDHDFTTQTAKFDDAAAEKTENGQVVYDYSRDGAIVYEDDYNNKDKRRNYWLSLNVNF